MKTPRAIDSFAEIATARITLEGTEPPIWREVELPTSITLKVLHEIVQAHHRLDGVPPLGVRHRRSHLRRARR